MAGFEYYGLFLTQESKDKLKEWLSNNGYKYIVEMNKTILDHCTLGHVSQVGKDFDVDTFLDSLGNPGRKVVVTHIGKSDKALAFKVNSPTIKSYCMNETPHITICTFNGGKPVDSNNITKWRNIEPIIVECKLEKR